MGTTDMARIREIRDLVVPLDGAFANAVVNFAQHDVSLVAVVSDVIEAGRPVVGFAFNSIGRFAQSGILRDRLIPRLRATPAEHLTDESGALDPARVRAAVMRDEKPGGHGDRAGAVAAIELAVWDLNAKLARLPAWQHIARTEGRDDSCDGVPTYAAGGYYHRGDSCARLVEELAGYRDLGFDAFKIKVGGASLGEDLERIHAAVEFAGAPYRIAVDANGRFGFEDAVRFAEAVDSIGLRWFEEPGDPLDFDLLRALADSTSSPLATGENLFSAPDVRNLLRHGGLRPGHDVLQMDAPLSYGLGEYLEMLNLVEASGHARSQCIPHGGHLINLHIAAGLGLGGCEAYPGVFLPVGGFSPACVLNEGLIRPSGAPGFGLEEKPELRPWLDRLLEGL